MKEAAKLDPKSHQAFEEMIIMKFDVNFDQISIDSAHEVIQSEDIETLSAFDSQPIAQVLKTVKGLSKTLVIRVNLKKAEEGYKFAIMVLKMMTGAETEELMQIIKLKHLLTEVYRVAFSTTGSQMYDPLDRPSKMTLECKEQVDKIFEGDKFGIYQKAKALMFVGKSYVSKKEREKAEATLLEAQSMITAEYGEDHTLAAKFNQFLIEAYNMRPES